MRPGTKKAVELTEWSPVVPVLPLKRDDKRAFVLNLCRVPMYSRQWRCWWDFCKFGFPVRSGNVMQCGILDPVDILRHWNLKFHFVERTDLTQRGGQPRIFEFSPSGVPFRGNPWIPFS